MIKIIKIGKIKRKSLLSEFEFFLKRIKKFSKIEVNSIQESKSKSKKIVVKDESDRLLEKLDKTSYSICLDRKGIKLNSIEFSIKINDVISHNKSPAFIIGGAYGTSEALKNSVDFRLSLSDLTLQHDVSLLVIMEQIYRAFTIMRNHPYHK